MTTHSLLRAVGALACTAGLAFAAAALADIPCPGDVNGDGKVTQFDADLVIVAFGTDGSAVPGSDLNGDGVVNIDDFLLVSANFGNDCCPGDVNFDGVVDFDDFLLLSADFGGPGTFPGTDINNDGVVDAIDFNILSANFGNNCHG